MIKKMKCNEPIEVKGAIPLLVSRFARDLSRCRRLDEVFQSECRLANRERVNWDENIQFFDGLSGVLDFHKFLNYWVLEFAHRAHAARLQVSISHSRQPTCPRFHVDNVPLRLISTLHGPGTQWLRAQDVKLTSDNRIEQNIDEELIQQMASGSVGFFHGAGGDLTNIAGVVHRSPPDMEDRVILKIDKIP